MDNAYELPNRADISEVVFSNSPNILELRSEMLNSREEQINEILKRRKPMLKELYYMMNHCDETDSILEIKQDFDDICEKEMDEFIASKNLDSILQSPKLSEDIENENIEEVLTEGMANASTPTSQEIDNTGSKSLSAEITKTPVRIIAKKPPQRTTIPSKIPNHYYDFKNNAVKAANAEAWQLNVRSQPLHKLIEHSNKAMSTQSFKAAREELKQLWVHQKIDSLKKLNQWSFRQIRKHKAPPRTKTHWDHLLEEMKWLRTDFREERKWKIAMAHQIGKWVMEWHTTDNKQDVCVKVASQPSVPQKTELEDIDMEDVINHEFIDNSLELSDLTFSNDIVCQPEIEEAAAHASTPEEIIFKGDKDPMLLSDTKSCKSERKDFPLPFVVNEKSRRMLFDLDPSAVIVAIADSFTDISALFPDLPILYPPNPDDGEAYLDIAEQGYIVPVTKLLHSRPIMKDKPVWKKARMSNVVDIKHFQYSQDEDPIVGMPRTPIPDAFFQCQSPIFSLKKMRESVLPTIVSEPKGSAPTDFSLPSGWSIEDDELLKEYARRYAFNWDLVADLFNCKRRSPSIEFHTSWDFYVRWVQIDKQPTDLIKHIPGIPVAQRFDPTKISPLVTLKDPKQKGTKSDNSKPFYKRSSIADAIKKAVKKREAAQRTVAGTPKKVNLTAHETHSQSQGGEGRVLTPADLGQMKYERDRSYAQAMLEQKQAAVAAYAMHGHARPLLSRAGANPMASTNRTPTQGPAASTPSAQASTSIPPTTPNSVPTTTPSTATSAQPRPSANPQPPQTSPKPNSPMVRMPPGTRMNQEQVQALLAARNATIIRPHNATPTTGFAKVRPGAKLAEGSTAPSVAATNTALAAIAAQYPQLSPEIAQKLALQAHQAQLYQLLQQQKQAQQNQAHQMSADSQNNNASLIAFQQAQAALSQAQLTPELLASIEKQRQLRQQTAYQQAHAQAAQAARVAKTAQTLQALALASSRGQVSAAAAAAAAAAAGSPVLLPSSHSPVPGNSQLDQHAGNQNVASNQRNRSPAKPRKRPNQPQQLPPGNDGNN